MSAPRPQQFIAGDDAPGRPTAGTGCPAAEGGSVGEEVEATPQAVMPAASIRTDAAVVVE